MDIARKALSFLDAKLIDDILEKSDVVEIAANTEILSQGQYVKVIPIVLSGLIKVYTSTKNKELLLYYIKPEESCIMSFAAALKNDKSKVFARTELNSSVLLLPANFVDGWIKNYPNFNHLFFGLYNKRYDDLLSTIHHVLFDKMDVRLYDFLVQRMALTQHQAIKISHRQIAEELGTAREVITRTLKKLESEGKIRQQDSTIEVIE